MRLSLPNIARASALLAFLGLFPGFLLYHYSIAQGWIPPVLGGLFGVVSAMTAVVALALAPWMARRGLDGALVPASAIVVAMAYFALWAIVNAACLPGEPYAQSALKETFAMLGTWIATLFVGANFPFAPRSRRALVISGVLIVLVLLHAMGKFKSPLGPYLTFRGDGTEADGVSSYQAIGRSIVVTTVFLSGMLGGLRARATLLTVGCLLLLLVGSRTDTFTLAAVTVAAVGLATVRGRNLGLMIGAGVIGYLLFYFLAPFFLATRNAEILDLGQSTSWQARQELMGIAMRVITTHPIIGDFGYHWRIGGSGYYAHNALSSWTNYGMLGFVLYVGLIAYFAAVSLKRLMADLTDPAWFAAFLLNTAALMQAVFAVPVFSPLPALGWGVALNAMRVAAHATTELPNTGPESGELVLEPAH